MREEVISRLLGYTSIACWLGAQFPQIVVNWRRKSVDGLALPFLANWFLGDTTNLIGCLLTDQLPFQTVLATYFVFVDICLVSQFLHYDASRHAKSISVVTSSLARQSRTSLLTHSPQEGHAFPRRHPNRSHSVSQSSDPAEPLTDVTLAQSELDYREGSSIASEEDVHGSRRRWRSRGSRRASSLIGLPESFVADASDHHWDTRRHISLERDDAREDTVDAESESMPSMLVDSFYSEDGDRARAGGKHVSWTQESPVRENNNNGSQRESQLLDDVGPSSRTAPSTARGRQLTRPNVDDSPLAIEPPTLAEAAATLPRARRASAASVSASRRSASIVYLAVFALFTFSYSHSGFRKSAGSEGRVLSLIPRSIPDGTSTSLPSTHSTLLSVVTAPDSAVHISRDVASLVFPDKETKLFIGRLSAWTCTTLYLTSRLPQIWKNFARQSVEGLSMYLFFFAFLGNLFYVLSILTSPNMDLPESQARQFIRDSVPYLLGSGGTLLFDITILLQSLLYNPRRRLMRRRARRRSVLVGAASEEERRVLLEVDHNV